VAARDGQIEYEYEYEHVDEYNYEDGYAHAHGYDGVSAGSSGQCPLESRPDARSQDGLGHRSLSVRTGQRSL
jgi:hypothetical protein